MISRAAFQSSFNYKLEVSKINTFYKKIDDAYLVILLNYLIQRLGKKNALGSVFSLYELHR